MLLAGFFMGATINAWMTHPAPPLAVIADDTPAPIPVVRIDGIRNGTLVGSMTGVVRLVARDLIIFSNTNGSFAIRDSKLLTNVIEISVPPGMHFVASKRGKKYYPIGSASAANLAPANRVYFPTAEAARGAGFVQ